MNLVYKGKTKDVFALDNGNYLLKFKDDATGKDGVFDPGANHVGCTIEGLGQHALELTTYFYTMLTEKGIPNHFVKSNLEEGTMEVIPAERFGKGLEVICRLKAVGSFFRRYGDFCKEGQDLDYYVEITLKDDDREDPLITSDALDMLGILKYDEYETLKKSTIEITKIVKDVLAAKGATLYDIKFEFGITKEGEVILIDEISGGNMRAAVDGKFLKPLEYAPLILGK
ncbi:MAG: phosphoribosylaminoimidazolesuccinocarboxamide synthase [Clostridia bacterium]|nr:phosphoribosylaminoimidazolesuccinocarboxamide synthase [Clostridia bacterium]MDY5264391.1 phosphoribosylaminoimidazolesuccinocarboxamide synthase [Eubacteriales bacterium]MDY5440353.1 phosphoribosylaminoimidazolesuccinocarboxamide synthase [Eubacteriales bacterium]